ncbi:uncharacterized protein [Porites lutea]|uniref:uncharacterized protein n=1 Tax=Porites lutea TaxID=51062 RepID=UPI003CC65FF1
MQECCRVFNESGRLFSEKEERFWNAAFVIEITVVFLLNAFTLAIYTRNRHLRKRSTFLIINLTVADLLVGTVVGLLQILEPDNLERDLAFSWQSFVYWTLHELFLVASLANISLISLERLHATLFPFRHCLVGKRVYLTIILCSWSFALTLSSVIALLYLRASPAFLYVYAALIFLIVLILTLSNAIIISAVKNNPLSPNAGPILSTERKLTVTLFIVSVASFLTILPWAISTVVPQRILSKLCPELFNPILNPLIYVIRMQEFRRAAKKLIRKKKSESIDIEPVESLAM